MACYCPWFWVFQVVIAADRHIMGTNRNGRVWNVLTWATIGVITVLTVVMFVLQVDGLQRLAPLLVLQTGRRHGLRPVFLPAVGC